MQNANRLGLAFLPGFSFVANGGIDNTQLFKLGPVKAP